MISNSTVRISNKNDLKPTTLTRLSKYRLSLSSVAQRYGHESSLITYAFLICSIVVAFTSAAKFLHVLFPLLSLIIAAYFLSKKSEYLIELIMWLLFLTPMIRRIVDFHAGYQTVSFIMLAPYLASGIIVPAAIDKLIKVSYFKYRIIFFTIYMCILYGVVLAFFNSSYISGLYTATIWIAPPSVGLFIMLAHPAVRRRQREYFIRSLVVGIPLISVYGVIQFLDPPIWDRYWMLQTNMTTIGSPEPFMVRVFGTMNSPGPYAQSIVLALLIVMSQNIKFRIPIIAVATIAVLLSMVRTSWIGFIVAIFYLLAVGNDLKVKSKVLVTSFILISSILLVAQVPQIGSVLTDRFDSFLSLKSDTSYDARSDGYTIFFNDTLFAYPLGTGLGSTGIVGASADGKSGSMVDGAVIEIGSALGAFAGSVYLIAILVILVQCLMVSSRYSFDPFISSCALTVLAAATMLTSGNTVVGDCGMFFWIAAAFCLSGESHVL